MRYIERVTAFKVSHRATAFESTEIVFSKPKRQLVCPQTILLRIECFLNIWSPALPPPEMVVPASPLVRKARKKRRKQKKTRRRSPHLRRHRKIRNWSASDIFLMIAFRKVNTTLFCWFPTTRKNGISDGQEVDTTLSSRSSRSSKGNAQP